MDRGPEMLRIPLKLHPMLDNLDEFRYILLEGGRGGGKSQSVARFVLYLAERYNLRVVCGREIQKSITESVYSIMQDLILQYQLNYEVQSTKLIHKKSGSTINFRGFREQGAFNIQGMEGVDILWIDEAQAVTKPTLDVLIPTIRKEKAKIFFTMNRHVADDPVFDMFSLREDCLHIHINYFDNPYCTEALKHEASQCKLKSEEDYNHIWLGIPLGRSEDCLFGFEELMETKINKHELRAGYFTKIGGFDIARYGDDKCAAVILQQMGALHWEVSHVEQWDHRDLAYTTGRILDISTTHNTNEDIIDEDGIGAGPLDMLNKGRQLSKFQGFRNIPINFSENRYFANARTENAYKVKEMVSKHQLALNDDEMIKELLTLRYTYDHYQRKILISKEVMRKLGVKSPNLADALIMAVSLVGKVKQQQDRQYFNQPQIQQEANLFQIAGFR